MIEYGKAAGESSERLGSGRGGGGGSVDLGGASDFVGDAVDRISSMPPEQLLVIGIVILVGVVILRRA